MKKYYIGLIIIGLFVLGLTGFTIFQASGAKQDNETERRAQEIANKLNTYVYDKGVPESLAEANIKDVPSTITYTKKDSDKYEFCVTYKNAGSGYNSVGLTDILAGSLQEPRSGVSYDDYNYQEDDSYAPSSLYMPYTHKAGKNCQTVQSYDNYDDPYNNKILRPLCEGGLCDDNDGGFAPNADDTERQTDIKSLHAQVETYYALNGFYPTFANMNDTAWRSANMKGLDKEALRDPKGTGYLLASKSTKNAYSYVVSSDTGKTCDNTTGNDCAFYTLQATLNNGTAYTKLSLN